MLSRALVLLWLATYPVVCPVADAPAASPDAAGPADAPAASPDTARPAAAPLVLSEPPEPLAPKQPRTEADQHRLHAVALYGAARLQEQRGELASALRGYQRAWRYDPAAKTALADAVRVADRLRRYTEAARYARQFQPGDHVDAALVQRAAIHLLDQQDWPGALWMYELLASQLEREQRPRGARVQFQLELGRLYFINGKYCPAADAFARVVSALDGPQEHGLTDRTYAAVLGDPSRTYRLFAESFIQADRLDEARVALRRAYATADEAPRLAYHMARIAVREQKHADGLGRLETYLRSGSTTEDAAPYALLAEALEALGRADELCPRLDRLQEQQPDNSTLAMFAADRHAAAGRFERAASLYRTAADRTAAPAAYAGLASVYRRQRKAEALVKLVAEFLEKSGSNSLTGLSAALDLASADEPWLRELGDAAEANAPPDAGPVTTARWLAALLVALEARRFEATERLMARAPPELPAGQRAALHHQWGSALSAAGRHAEAAEVLRRAAGENQFREFRPILLVQASRAFEDAGQTDEALAAAQEANRLLPDSPMTAAFVAGVHDRSGRKEQAAALYRQFVERFDSQTNGPRHLVRQARMRLSHLVLDADESEEWLEQVLDEWPDDDWALNDLSYLWSERGKHPERALAMVQRAVAAAPENLAYRDSLGWALYRLGRYEEAVVELERAAGQSSGVVLEHLAEACLKVGRRDAAIDAWRRAAEAFHASGEQQKADAMHERIRSVEQPGE